MSAQRKRVTIEELAREIAARNANKDAEGWLTAVVAGILPHIRGMVEWRKIACPSAPGGMPSTDANEFDASWCLTRQDANTAIALLEAERPLWQQYERQAEAKRNAGRYTLEEASDMLEQNTGERASAMLRTLIKAAKDEVLPVREPGRQARYKSETIETFYHEVYWNDLNKWLETNEPRIVWRFPDPQGDAAGNAAKKTPQDRATLRAEAALNTRGCKRQILENWDKILQLYGSAANGNHVLRWFKKSNVCDQLPTIKTIQNHLSQLKTQNLIP